MIWALTTLLFISCAPNKETTDSGLLRSNFQTTVDGKKTDLFILRNKNNMEVCVTNFGGRIVSIMVPDKNGKMQDVVLGFGSVQDYMKIPSDFGASIGRYANRINHGKFMLDGKTYQLSLNDHGRHCLHGGKKGFQYRVYDAKQINSQELELTYLSKDKEEGFPGDIKCKVIMTLTNDNSIDIQYEATTDKPTIVNLTNHSYFNLDGDGQSNAKQLLMINADNYTPIDSTFITTGEIAKVEGTPMDFRKPTPIGLHIKDNYQQLKNGNGYDHNWVLNTKGDIKQICASLKSIKTGIILNVYTTEPGVQFYAGNFLDGTVKGKKGVAYPQRASVVLETQKYPDSPNKKQWPSPILRPGQKYTSHTIFKFSVQK